jgi:hypothetical protein
MVKSLSLVLMILVIVQACTQKATDHNDFWESKNAYFGQTPPGEVPQIFAPNMLTDSGIVLSRVVFSKNGKEFYYTVAKHWFDSEGTVVKCLSYDGEKWQEPKIIAEKVSNPTLSPDESKMYFGGPKSSVWRSERVKGSWSEPKEFLNKDYGLYNFMPTNSGTFYVGSNGTGGSKQDYSTYDFCTFQMNKTDTTIQSLGQPLNSSVGFDGDLYISPDESFIILSANETPTFECELWISFRKADKTWSNPKSLGSAINDGLAHRFGQYVTPDKKYLIYTKGTSEKDCHFYWVRFDRLLEKLRKEE